MSLIEKIKSTSNITYYLQSPALKKSQVNNNLSAQEGKKVPIEDNKLNDKSKQMLLYLAGLGAVAAASIYIVKHRGVGGKKVPVSHSDLSTPEGTQNLSNSSPVSDFISAPVQKISKYITSLAEGLSTYMGEKIVPERLISVMDKKEFLEAVSKLKRENYVLSKENIEKGIFRADLHSHSNYSDGKGSVEHIMSQVAEYADKLFSKTGEKFIYALTDHDCAESSKEALKLIADNPEKYKNVRFVVGSEVSYLMKTFGKTTNQYETTELLVYGFNPFSLKVEAFFKDVLNRRLNARKNYIKDLSEKFPDTKFSEEEFLNVFLGDRVNQNPILNSFWQLYHYGQVKRELSNNARYKKLNPEEYFKECMQNAPEKLYFDEFKNKNIIEKWVAENDDIKVINEKYKPHDIDGKLDKTSENTIDDILLAFKDEENCVVGFAHPYYLVDRANNVSGLVDYVQSKLQNMLKVTESYHQAYSPELLKSKGPDIEKISKLCEDKNLIPIGGRDNHTADFLPQSCLG